MKALTLHQPWASLVAAGSKQIETRSWATKYRGPLVIHAAKEMPTEALRFAELSWACRQALEPIYGGGWYEAPKYFLPRGVPLAVVTVEDVVPTDGFDPGPFEGPFGNFAPGRFAWMLGPVTAIPDALQYPTKGRQRLWWYPDALLPKIAKVPS